MAIADFCMQPQQNLLGLMQPQSSTYNLTYFYLTCVSGAYIGRLMSLRLLLA